MASKVFLTIFAPIKNSKMANIKPTYNAKDVTFANSKTIPFQRWYPYIEGYSPEFVKTIIKENLSGASLIYEPFAGTGTTLFASDVMGINTIYSEVNPLLRFLIKAKIDVLELSGTDRNVVGTLLRTKAETIFEDIKKLRPSKALDNAYKAVFDNSVYFPEATYKTVLKLRSYIDNLYEESGLFSNERIAADLLCVAVFSCLLPVSYLKKQGDVRFKTEDEKKNEMKVLQEVLPVKIMQIAEDVMQTEMVLTTNHELAVENAKSIGKYESQQKISAVITSPPYLNGTNYFRNTKLELWFLKELKVKEDLRTFRDEALTSAICDVKQVYRDADNPVHSILLDAAITELNNSNYDRRIPLMAKCYFMEMYQLFSGLRKHLDRNAKLFIDLGDSIFKGVHIQTDNILVQVLEDLGYVFEKKIVLRQRRSRNGKMLSQVLLSFSYN